MINTTINTQTPNDSFPEDQDTQLQTGHHLSQVLNDMPTGGPPSARIPQGEVASLKFFQLNIHHSKIATFELYQRITPHVVALIQEPWAHKTRLKGLLPGLKAFYHTSQDVSINPRAAIIAHDSIDILPLPQFTNRDIASAIWTTSSKNLVLKRIVLISWYWHAQDPLPTLLEQLFLYMAEQGLEHVLCTDSNAHSPMWGDRHEDHRGMLLEEFLVMHQIHVHNAGTSPTFVGPMGSTSIDITGTSPLLIDRCHSWNCGSTPSYSDHNLISFNIRLPMEKILIKARRLKQCDWDRYTLEVDRAVRRLPTSNKWTRPALDRQAVLFQRMIHKALDVVAPKVKVIKDRTYKWWTDELFQSRQRVRALLHQAQLHNDPDDWSSYRSHLKDYKYLIKTSRLDSWKTFTSQSTTSELQARLNKIIFSENKTNIGSLLTPAGDYTHSMDDSLELLLSEHFPGSTPIPRPDMITTPEVRIPITTRPLPWITIPLLKRAIAGFNKHKTPGPDEIYPETLRHLPESALEHLLAMFQASLTLSYIPRAWKLARVIFIPKVGKSDYSDPRSFRPITLSSFILKTLERLVLWHLDSTYLMDNPLHPNQFGFRKGHSTEEAISQILSRLEVNKKHRRPTIAIFLDIKGAFDTVTYGAITRNLRDRGINPATMAWYHNLLVERITYAYNDTTGAKQYIRHAKGVPQGGILSPTMWNVAFDEYIRNVSPLSDVTAAYADDVCILVSGHCYQEAHDNALRVMEYTERWSRQNDIVFCNKKSEYINYTWKRTDPPIILHLPLYGDPLPSTHHFKYLGLTFNRSLTWTEHIKSKVQKARHLLKGASSAFGKIWGPSPRMIKWTLESVVVPKVLYACHAWHAETYKAHIKLLLRRLTRLALIQISPCRIHSPTAGLEIITGTIPLYLRAREKNLHTFLRLIQYQMDKYIPSPHLDTLLREYSNSGISHCVHDRMAATRPLETRFSTAPPHERTPSVRWPHEDYTQSTPCSVHIYTDGSKISTPLHRGTGGGYSLFLQDGSAPPGRTVCQAYLTLCDTQTVFMAEIIALREAALTFTRLRMEGTLPPIHNAVFFTDSQAAIKALEAPFVTSRVVLECINALNTATSYANVHIQWIKAHVGHPGNEIADQLAKRGASTPAPVSGPGPHGRVPYSFIKNILRNHLLDAWSDAWIHREPCRQTKIWFPQPDLRKSHIIMSLDRITLGKVIRWITGHNFLRRHQNLLEPDIFTSSTCRLCFDDDETSSHLLLHCPILDITRNKITHQRRPQAPYVWNPRRLTQFIDLIADGMEDAVSDTPTARYYTHNNILITPTIAPMGPDPTGDSHPPSPS